MDKSQNFYTIMVIILFPVFVCSQNSKDYENETNSNQAKYNNAVIDQQKKYEKFSDSLYTKYNEQLKLRKNKYNDFKKGVQKKWGNVFEPSRHVWVEYSKDTLCAGLVDFSSGAVSFHTLRTVKDTKKTYYARVKKAIVDFIYSKGTKASTPIHTVNPKKQFLKEPLLKGIVSDEKGVALDNSNTPSFVEKKVDQAVNHIFSSKRKDDRYVVTLTLTPDYLKTLAMPYLPIIEKYANRFNLNPSLVLAMIHTESFFNPMARSGADAIGLMQLVIDKGGLDAYTFIYGKGSVPSIMDLYNPQKNIMLGCAYMHILKVRFFSGVFNQQSKVYCSIAGYNTGAHNVAKAFTGKRHLGPALVVINQYEDSKEVYNYLIRHLPYAETRDYLKKVVDRVELYK